MQRTTYHVLVGIRFWPGANANKGAHLAEQKSALLATLCLNIFRRQSARVQEQTAAWMPKQPASALLPACQPCLLDVLTLMLPNHTVEVQGGQKDEIW